MARSSGRLPPELREYLRTQATNALRRPPMEPEIPISTVPLVEASVKRADLLYFRTLRASGVSQEAIDEAVSQLATEERNNPNIPRENRMSPFIYATLAKDEGNALYLRGQYEQAVGKYEEAMRVYLGEDATLPVPNYRTYYDAMDAEEERHMLDLIACASNIAQCYYKQGKLVEVTIDWYEEVDEIALAVKMHSAPDAASWIDLQMNMIEWYTLIVKAEYRTHELYKSLGNSSLATLYCIAASRRTKQVHRFQPLAAKVIRLRRPWDESEMGKLRHPDPSKLYDMEITHPELQIHGVWKRLETRSPKPPSRSCQSAWIWNGKLYVTGGVLNLVEQEHHDFWCLTLSDMRWRRLPDPPRLRMKLALSTQLPLARHDSKVYLFYGNKKVWQFDLETEHWSAVNTAFTGRWPYLREDLVEFSSAVLDNKLYIFGGDDNVSHLGCNIFMALDLDTLQWEHISGTSGHVPCLHEPNLRENASMWAVSEQHKLYLLGGSADRTNAHQKDMPGAGATDHAYNDLWSFDCVSKTWYRERWRGNRPCPRTEMGSAWNPVLKRGIVYGGYNGDMPSGLSPMLYEFAYYGDSFLFDPETKMWQHIIAKGVPSYRAMSSLVCDPDTGAIYLFGGYVNTDYMPMDKGMTRSYNDLWQLKLDMPGGLMTDEDREIDFRTETVGPWKRCYYCGNVGLDYKKCAGTCRGRYFFCSKECQRAGWPEHKQAQGCRKAA